MLYFMQCCWWRLALYVCEIYAAKPIQLKSMLFKMAESSFYNYNKSKTVRTRPNRLMENMALQKNCKVGYDTKASREAAKEVNGSDTASLDITR